MRPSLWRTHARVLAALAVVYGVIAVLVWPSGRDVLSERLTHARVILSGVGLVHFAVVSTAFIFAFRPRPFTLLRSYASTLALLGVLVGLAQL